MIPSQYELLKARLQLVRNDLNELLPKISDDMAGWAPGPGVRTFAGQLFEIIEPELEAVYFLIHGRRMSDDEIVAEVGDMRSVANLKNALLETRAKTLELLDSYTDAQLAEVIPITHPWFIASGLPQAPRAEVFISIAQHEWYHVGQLVTYFWTRGDNPYEW